jgi:hypothetical protein
MSTTIFYKVRGSAEWTKVEVEAYGIDRHYLARGMLQSLSGWEGCGFIAVGHIDRTRKIEFVVYSKGGPGDRKSEMMILVYPVGSEEVTVEDCERGEALVDYEKCNAGRQSVGRR